MSINDAQSEVVKLQQHLVLLREEYVKLQQRHKTLERNFNVLNSTTKLDQDSFVCRLLKTVAELFNRELYRSRFVLVFQVFILVFSCVLVIFPSNSTGRLCTGTDLY